MGDRRPKKRDRTQPSSQPPRRDVFAEYGLSHADFDVESGRGKSFLSGQRIVWMTIKHLPSGRSVSGKIGTTKKGADLQRDELLRILLQSFRRT
jgi:hypothetical protein